MINILLYNDNLAIEDAIRQKSADFGKLEIVAPSPGLADMARTRFSDAHSNCSVITISKFIKDQLSALLDEGLLDNYRGKSELLLLLATVWKNTEHVGGIEIFKRCFQILTDFRSFTMSDDVLTTVLEEYDETTANAVLWFHKVLNQLEVIDEHRSYFLLGERLREGDLPIEYDKDTVIMFWGFDFLTGSQVDLLNSLGIWHDVIIPFSKTSFDKSSQLDWIQWLVKNEASVEVIDEEKERGNINYLKFSKGYMAPLVQSLKEEQFKEKTVEYVLGSKNIELDFISELPSAKSQYKTSIDLFKSKLNMLVQDLMRIEYPLESNELKELLSCEIQSAIKTQDFRLLKVISIIKENIDEWGSLSEENTMVSLFDIQIILEASALNLPRNSVISSMKIKPTSAVRSLKDLHKENSSQVQLLCLQSAYGPVKNSGSQYTESVEKYLAAIGPVRRGELEFLILKDKIETFLENSNTYLLVEKGLLEHDLGWSSIFPDERLKEIPFKLETNTDKAYLELPKKNIELKSISASRLQVYLDCPKKYYYQSVLGFRKEIKLRGVIDIMELGSLEHQTIEEYLKRNNSYDNNIHIDLINELINSRKIDESLVEAYFIEVKALTSKIIAELLIMKNDLGISLNFEYPIKIETNNITSRGYIDCYGVKGDHLFILDFKRGAGSIPTIKGLNEFDKVQLWFYLDKLHKLGQKFKKVTIGYVNLSSLEDSLIITNDEIFVEEVTNHDINFMNKIKFQEDLIHKVELYTKFENDLLDNLKASKEFEAKPKEAKTCEYCELNILCSKKEQDNGC